MGRLWILFLLLLICIPTLTWAQAIVGPDQMNQCDQATFTVTITNASATQDACFLTVTHSVPNDGFLYVPGSTTITLNETAESFTNDPTGDVWDIDAIRGSAYSLPPGESITISYDMATTCVAVSGTDIITVDFEDCADPGVPLQNVSTTSVEILPGAIVISKTPSVQDASVGDLVTWTLTVESTGLGSVSNVEIHDVLGSGLAFSSATSGGANAGQLTAWDAATTPSLASIAAGDSVSVQLVAEVIACSGLINTADATWGCGASDVCHDTVLDGETVTASLNLIVANPSLSFVAPNPVIPYCSGGTQVIIPITNSGVGTARHVELCCSLQLLEVINVQGGVTYSDGCFTIPDIPAGDTFDLTFDVVYSGDWCAGGPSGTNVFELAYANDCGVPFLSRPQFSTLSSQAGPSLAVTKTGPDSLRPGETASYDITVAYVGDLGCDDGSASAFTIVDSYPDGFTVIDAAGGVHNPGDRTITWTYDPNTDPPFSETIQLRAPTGCDACAIPGGGTDPNTVTVTGTDCCGCTITGSASAATTILCEGYGDGMTLFSSTISLNRTTVVRCSSDYDVEVTHTYVFGDDPALDDFLLDEFTYFVDGNDNLLYESGTAAVTGATLGAVLDGTPTGRLELSLADSTSARGKTIVYTYHLSVLGLDDPSCQASGYPINAGIELDPGASSVGYCGTMYADPAQRLSVTAQPPAMSVSIDGIPVIQEYCATYDVTITLNRTSDLATPHDVRLVLTNNGDSILDLSQAVCGGNVGPTDGTTCTAPIMSGSTVEWRFADAFSTGSTATLSFPVTVPCGGPLANLSVVATYDDLCHDDDVYDDSCSTSASDQASLSLSADVYTRKSPEILYATTRYVSWSVVLHNTGNGVAYNTWVDDVLGSGLIYDSVRSSINNPAGATEYPNLDHNGGIINGVSWVIDELQPGELRTITVAAELVSCSDLTNNISASWGCGDSDCQLPRTDDSSVIVPRGNIVATSFSPTPVAMCSDNPATITVKNVGVTTVYSIIANVTLPTGLVYLGNPEVQINGAAWLPVPDPIGVPGPALSWTSAEIPALSSIDPKDVLKIRFDYTVGCGFKGGNLSFQAAYESPCRNPRTTEIGTFAISLTPTKVLVAARQVSPAPGEAIECGGQAIWEIDVTNDGSILVPVVRVEALLDDGLAFVDSQGDPTYGPADGGSNSLQMVTWELVDLPVDAVATLSITATSAGGGLDCEALDVFIDASWGCGVVDGASATNDADCITTSPITTSISATRQPPLDLSASLSPESIEGCEASTALTLTIQNTSAVATTANVDVVITLPAQLSYASGSTEIDCGGGFVSAGNPNAVGQTLTWYDIAAEGEASDACESIPPGGTIRLRFDVDVSCYFTTQNIPITVYSYDCCGNSQYAASTSATLTSLTPALTLDKSPANTTLNCYDAEDTAMWTITIVNTGSGTADWIRVTDTLGASLVLDSSDSPTGGVGISMGSQMVGWEIGPLAPAGIFTATVTAHLAQPANDCSLSLRRDTAAVLWGCGAFDGNPNTSAEATCAIGSTVQDQANVRLPNLSISPADIIPTFICAGDGIVPSSGEIHLVVRNTGDGDVAADFEITLVEATTGYSVSDWFTNLGGTLPLTAGASQELVFSDLDVSCSECDYNITVAIDFLDEICECRENDNLAALQETITIPDLVVDSAALSVSCAGDGQIRVQGPITVRNDGCGDAITGNLRYRVTLYDGAGCTGTAIDTFTQTWSGVNIGSNGGTEQRTLNLVRALDLCSVNQVSVLVEVDDNNVFCECSGANNALCAGTSSLALPDLEITNIAAKVPNACNSGSIDVTVRNVGSGASPAGITVRVAGDASGEAVTPILAPSASAMVSIPLDTSLTCGPKDITVTVDPEGTLCECRSADNSEAAAFTVSDPDLVISDLLALCQIDGTVHVMATASNNGGEASGSVVLRVLVDGIPINTSVVALDPGETLPIDLFSDALSCGTEHTVRVEFDPDGEVCECSEANNAQQASVTCPCPALSVNKIVTDISRNGSSVGTAGPVEPGDVVFYRFIIENVAAGTAFNVDFSDTLPVGMVVETNTPGNAGTYAVTAPTASGSLALVDGAEAFTSSIAATLYGGETLTADYAVRVTAAITQGTDLVNEAVATGERPDGSAIPGSNPSLGDSLDADVEDPDADDTGITVLGTAVPALSVDKTIIDIKRIGASIGISGPVEPGDVVSYRFVITNVGAGTAFGVDFYDTLPAGMETAAGGTYEVSGPPSAGSLQLAAGAATFVTSISATVSAAETLTADFDAVVSSGIEQGMDLVNTAVASGVDGFGAEIPGANPSAGDTSDGDAEDPDPDDTGIAVIGAEKPALSVDKIITDILRRGSSIGIAGPVEPGDLVFYRYTISNVGLGTAYGVEFTDALPIGMVTETDAPSDAGDYVVSAPFASGSLALADAVGSFATSIGATIAGGETLTANYAVLVTSDIAQGTDLVNVATATGVDGAGGSIPGENSDLGDTSDGDAEDPDADDTGITVLGTREPALAVDKRVTGVIRSGSPVGVVDPVLYGDIIEYTVTIRNVGLGTAYAVEFTDTLPSGLETETDAPGNAGAYVVSIPSASGSLAVPDGASTFTTVLNATIAGGESLTAVYTVLVTPTAIPAIDLVNTVSAVGEDGAGTPIPEESLATGDTSDDDVEDPDADDTGIASVRVGSPALVTRKGVIAIDRQGTAIFGTVVEPGDIVTYELGVTNVGSGPAQSVDLVDVLPAGFLYQGNPSATWPSGSSTAPPTGTPGPTLTWTLNADLEPGEDLVLSFDALVTSDIVQAARYVNTVTATGEDSAGQPIPPDHRAVVPEDDDPDDSSHVSLTGAIPALVTDKAILNIVRNGSSLGPESAVQSFDLVTYQLQVTNVGLGTAYEVAVHDTLPVPFAFVSGTTQGSWPYRIGAFTRNPTGAPGPTLWWDTEATLASGETLTMTFEAFVDGLAIPGNEYTNVLQAEGIDGAGTPILPNLSGIVVEDTDPDDRDDVTLTGIAEQPALVTTKRVTEIIRAGDPVIDSRIEQGDIVEYELTVQNVGAATATNVNISDQLPSAFGYIDAASDASWPLGSSFADPATGTDGLQWLFSATLRPGDRLVLQFLAFVMGPIYDGSAYTNFMKATGVGPNGTPIPEDQRSSVPGDIDPDDASQVTLIGRSAYVQGEGGSLVTVPILRKTAEVLSSGACEAWNASVDRLWFQTDIAMYAAAEFELLGQIPDAASLIPASLLPTWTRTVRSEAADYAFDNLLQVDALSSIGISLSHGPLIQERADMQGIPAIQVLERRLNELSTRAGISEALLPLPERWIFLEYEGGEPIYEAQREDLLGPSGSWTVLDEDVIASALGMGLVKQAMEIKTLLASTAPIDRYLGWVLVEVLSNKILALELDLTLRKDDAPAYIPHASRWDAESGSYTTTDEASLLFDQLSLVWGLSQASSLIDTADNVWPAGERELQDRVSDAAARTLHEVLVVIHTLHLTPDQAWIGRRVPGVDAFDAASTLDLGLLLVALEAAQNVVAEGDRTLLEGMKRLAVDALAERQDAAGWFSVVEGPNAETTWSLLPQLAGIRGLLAGADLLAGGLDRAQAAFDALDTRLWVDTIGTGLYASQGTLEWQTYCYTPLEIGLATGALRELALRSSDERRATILTRMSGFVRTIVDDAALQLSNASPAHATFTRGTDAGAVAPIRTDGIAGLLAPVLQQRLCLEAESPDGGSCSGWTATERDPWYQTDISMFAAYVIQDRLPEIEDYADADLNAVTFHSGLGIPFDSIAVLRSAVERYGLETDVTAATQILDPIAIPYAAGSPETALGTLAWNPSTFDSRILASAQGMTLLREAQETRQLLAQGEKEPHEQLQERLLLSSILQRLIMLEQLQSSGPDDVSYIPHAVAWSGNAADSWTVLDRGSTLFDQLSLLYGLSEAYALLADARIQSLLEAQPFPRTDWELIVLELMGDVLRTLEVAHLDSTANVLMDESSPALTGWIRRDSLSLVHLGLLSSALDHVLAVFGEKSDIGGRALDLLAAEVSFLRETLFDGRGGFNESWPLESSTEPSCDRQTLAGQAAALRALQAAQGWLGLEAEIVDRAFRTFDARFWDPSLFVYRTQGSLFEWCVTPLDLGLTVDALTRMVDQLTGAERYPLDMRLRLHIDRVLDGVPLHLSASMAFSQENSIAPDRAFAPVFDALVCFQSPVLTRVAGRAEPGDTIRYTISAENITEESFYNLVLEDLLPDGVTAIATDPVGERNDPGIRWGLDELLPSEERTWQILARVNDNVLVGEVLQNCATLTYTNAAGEPQPAREACVDEEIQSQDAGLVDALDAIEAAYRTDEAMHLATALETVACIAGSDWPNATLAHELADENLGILLGESGLGVPVRFAPQFPAADHRTFSLEETLKALALAAGLPEIPSFGHSIFLPYESGIPIVTNGSGFSATSPVITPAALGWTLAREARYAISCARSDDPLQRYLAEWVRFAIDNQLAWISNATISSEAGNPYLPQAIRATIAGEDISYGVSDTRSTVYDQASLLIGLLSTAQANVLEGRGQRLAEQLATETFEQLIRHWDEDSRVLFDPLETQDGSSAARWTDHGIAARALSMSRDLLTRKRGTADRILEAMAERALAQGAEVQAIEEAGRLLTLLLAGDALDEERYRAAALGGWDTLLARTYESEVYGYIFSPQAIRGWGHTPGQLGIVFDLLGALAGHPVERTDALRVADTILSANVLEDRVQLMSPSGYWTLHAQLRCSGIAPVFGRHRGVLPFWYDSLP